MDGDIAKAAVRSVARLHAYFWGNAKSNAAVKEVGLAEQGTYWYLDTRPDEYDSMSRSGISGKLKKAAHGIDAALKEHEYQTICHGDLKACNMSMSTDPSYVTFVDFQYLGKACPAKDLAYLFVCGMDIDGDFEERQESEMLRLYLHELAANGIGGDAQAPMPTLDGLQKALWVETKNNGAPACFGLLFNRCAIFASVVKSMSVFIFDSVRALSLTFSLLYY